MLLSFQGDSKVKHRRPENMYQVVVLSSLAFYSNMSFEDPQTETLCPKPYIMKALP